MRREIAKGEDGEAFGAGGSYGDEDIQGVWGAVDGAIYDVVGHQRDCGGGILRAIVR